MNRPFIKAGVVGLLVIAMSILLVAVFPSKAPGLPEGFFTPIIAFEFIETRAEVFQMFTATDGNLRQSMIDAMDFGNRLDYVYMCLYSLFLLLFAVRCAEVSGKKYYYIGALLALTVLFADALENIQLLGITSAIENGDLGAYLVRLHIFTWIKWGGIAAIFMVLVPWFMKGGLFSKAIGLTGIASFMLGIVSFLHRSIINEFFGLSVGLMFILMIIYCFKFRGNPA
ncbi:MAG: hypothetical protein GXP53_14935 [Deltaproteobacteria bacterium]|nr:hypothetical protein [Deltaproteobacteria bacterium]